MNSKVFEKLEYYKILGMIAERTSTERGRQRAENLTPFKDKDIIVKKGAIVTEAGELLKHEDFPPFEYIPDLASEIHTSSIQGAVLPAEKILEIYKLAIVSRKVYQYINRYRDEYAELDKLSHALFVDKVFEYHINQVFDNRGDIRDDASPGLKQIRKRLKSTKEELSNRVNRLLRRLSDNMITQENYITQRDGRIVLPVKSEHKRHIRGFIHSESATGQTVYIEPEEVLEYNNEVISLYFEEKREIEKILKNLTKLIASHGTELLDSLRAVAELDLYFAIAKFGIEYRCHFPEITEKGKTELIEARHPLLIRKLGYDTTVPLNIKFGESNVIIITGPNAGGKTVVLKTVGLISLLTFSGIPTPVHPDTKIAVFKKILIDIGDNQSIEEDLSTFSSHLNNIKFIVENADDETLVLLDEIGTGTDPAEGSALAMAILIRLKDSGSKVISTTHYGNLKIFAHQDDKFQNASMEFDNSELKPTYVFRQGIPGASYAFEIAGRLGFEKSLIDSAKEFSDPEKNKAEQFLLELEKKTGDYRELVRKADMENLRLKKMADLYKNRFEDIEKNKKKIINEEKKKAEDYLKEVNREVEKIIKQIRESGAEKDIIRDAKNRLRDLDRKNKKRERQIETSLAEDYTPAKGDYVMVAGTQTTGIIKELDKKSAVIESGTIRMKVKPGDLRPVSKKEYKNNQPQENSKYVHYSPSVESSRLDIRGRKPEESEFELVRFIDSAYTSNLGKIEILHGRGTGVLKSMVKELLKKHENVRKFYPADIESGGDGITIAELK